MGQHCMHTTNMDSFKLHDVAQNLPHKPYKERHTLTYNLYPSKNWKTSRSLMGSSFRKKSDGKLPPKAKPKSPNLKCSGNILFETTNTKSFKNNTFARRDAIVPRKRTPYATLSE